MTCTTRDFQKFAKEHGWTHSRTEGSHESWEKPGAKRVVVIDVKYRDMSNDHISSNLSTMGLTKEDLREFLGQPTKKKDKDGGEPQG